MNTTASPFSCVVTATPVATYEGVPVVYWCETHSQVSGRLCCPVEDRRHSLAETNAYYDGALRRFDDAVTAAKPKPILAGNFLSVVRDWAEQCDAAAAGGGRVNSITQAYVNGGN